MFKTYGGVDVSKVRCLSNEKFHQLKFYGRHNVALMTRDPERGQPHWIFLVFTCKNCDTKFYYHLPLWLKNTIGKKT